MSSNLTASAIFLKAICMQKIAISIATTLIVTAALVACNGSTGNNSGSGASLVKAVCTSSENWNALGLGMSLSDVQGILGKSNETAVTSASTIYTYESCRGFITAINAETGAATGTDVSGTVTWIAGRGVTAINSPVRIAGDVLCEVDYYNFPKGSDSTPCRAANNPF